MKNTIFGLIALTTIPPAHAQTQIPGPPDSLKSYLYKSQSAVHDGNVQTFRIPLSRTTHFVSPEPILSVDISSNDVTGDLPEKNVFRLKPDTGKMAPGSSFMVTIVTESFIASYELVCTNSTPETATRVQNTYVIEINPQAAVQLNNYDGITKCDFYKLCIHALALPRQIWHLRSRAYGLDAWVNNIFIAGDFLIFDVGMKNHTRLKYYLDEARFTLSDKSQVKAHVSQDIELKPLYSFYDTGTSIVKNRWRNFYIFRKFTFPSAKRLNIELSEKQISGRKITLQADYNEVLHADYLQ